MSITDTSSSRPLAFTASSSMIMQNGQAVEMMSAPVASASLVRSMFTRLPIVSSIHIRAPPAPQQKPFSRHRCRGAGLSGTEDADLLSRAVQQARRIHRLLSTPLVERSGTPHPVQVVDVLRNRTVDDRHFEVEGVEPLGALGRAQSPRVALILHVA